MVAGTGFRSLSCFSASISFSSCFIRARAKLVLVRSMSGSSVSTRL